MKNIPVFTTKYGAASLILDQIPYRSEAYIHIQDTLQPEQLVKECWDFCRACGAEKVYAAGHSFLEKYDEYTQIWRMRAVRIGLDDTDAALWPVQEQTLEQWRKAYNERMKNVPCAQWMTAEDGKKMLEAGDGYFIHRGETLLGIGRVSGEQIAALVGYRPGAGKDVVLALAHAITEDTIHVDVASANQKAVSFYRSLGFIPAKQLRTWYRIF